MKAGRCRNVLSVQLHQVLLMGNENQPCLCGDVQNSVAMSRRLTMEFRVLRLFCLVLFGFFPLFFSSLFSRLTSAFCFVLLWLKMLEYPGRGGVQIYYLCGGQ